MIKGIMNEIMQGQLFRVILRRLIKIEEKYETWSLFKNISGETSGVVETYTNIEVSQKGWANGNNAIALEIQAGELSQKDLFEADGTPILATVDANGNFALSGTPTATNYYIAWIVTGKQVDFANAGIPENKYIEEIERESYLVRNSSLNEVSPENVGDDLNMKTGGFKDDNVSTAVKLGSVTDTSLNTEKKDILGGINEVNSNDISATGSGIVSGCRPVVNAGDNTKIDISAGKYRIVDNYSIAGVPSFKYINFAGQTEIVLTYLTSLSATFLALDENGSLLQRTTPLTYEGEKPSVPCGIVSHINKATVDKCKFIGNIIPDSGLMASNMSSILGRLNDDGNAITPNGANLKLNRSEGIMFGAGINYSHSDNTPNIKRLNNSSEISFYKVKLTAGFSDFALDNEVPTDYYDPNQDGTLVAIPTNYFVAHRLIIEPSLDDAGKCATYLQYGQVAYDSLKKAVDTCLKRSNKQAIELYGVHNRAAIVVKQGCTDLSNKLESKIINLSKIGLSSLHTMEGYEDFAENIEIINGMTYHRQAISFYDSGGILYADIAKVYNFKRDDISFANADSSINTVSGDFDNDSMFAGDKILIFGSTNNNKIFTVVSVAALKIVVSETVINESAGANITVETAGKGDILFVFRNNIFTLNCTTGSGRHGRARIQLTEGSDTNPQKNYVYGILSGSEVILQNSITKPTGEFSMLLTALIPSVAFSVSDEFYSSRRWTDTKEIGGRGALATVLDKLRDNRNYKSGLGLTITINTAPTPDTGDLEMESGIVREIYLQDIYPLQCSLDGALVVNDFTTKYKKITDLYTIDKDALNGTLINKYFQIIVAVSLNANGFYDKLLFNLPNGSYINANDAFNDIKGFSNTSFPEGFKSVYLLGALVLKRGVNTLSNEATAFGVEYIDLREQKTGTSSSGSGTAAITNFSDVDFSIYNAIDSTKKHIVDCSQITTGTTRTTYWPDRNLDLGSPVFDDITLVNNVDEFSTDGTLLGNSDSAIPTEKAVKTYVDGYNPFDQNLNTYDNPIFLGLSIGKLTDLGADLLARFNSPSNYNETKDQDFSTKNATSHLATMWQSFTAADTGYLSAVSVHNGSGGTINNVQVKVFEGEGIGGNEIANATGITCGNNVFTKVNLSDLPYIVSGEKYTIQAISGDFYWNINTGGGYVNGTYITSGQDALFETYVADGFNFVFDKTNNRIGIGLIDPAYTLDVLGNFNLQGDSSEVSAIIRGDNTNLGTNWIATTKTSLGILAADAIVSLVSDGGGSVGSSIIFDEVNSSTQAYVDHWSIWRKTSGSGSSLVGYYGTLPGAGGVKIFEFGKAGRCWIRGLSGHASHAYMRYDTSTDELFYNTSALRYKENIDYTSDEILNRAKNLIENAKICKFDMKDGSALGKIGMIANDLELIEPKLCYYNGDNAIEGYNDGDTAPYLIKYIQHQKEIIDDLLTRVETLENA